VKRRIAKLIVFLLLGAIVNVAVAWGCAAWAGRWVSPSNSHPSDYGPFCNFDRPLQMPADSWAVLIWRQPCWTRVLTMVSSREPRPQDEYVFNALWLLPAYPHVHHEMGVPNWSRGATPPGRNESAWTLIEDCFGWPSLGLLARFQSDANCQVRARDWSAGPTITQPRRFVGDLSDLPYPRVLPLRPIFPGFAINTIFYAAVLWVLFAAPGSVRRRLRRRRGLCPACAYPVGVGGTCTECGKAVALSDVKATA
jgi:hypothetical protein